MQARKSERELSIKYSSLGHEKNADLGPVISPQAKQRIESLIESGEKEGASVMLDGRGVSVPGYEKGNFVGPTILHKVQVSHIHNNGCRQKNNQRCAGW